MTNGQITNPLTAFRFKVEIDSTIQAGFSECSGLLVETELEDVREGGVNDYMYRLPKGSKYINLTLKHGITNSDVLWNWHRDVVNGKFKRKTIGVVLLNAQNEERWRWNFKDAYPVKWVGPELKADGNTVAIETLELAHHGFDVKVTK